MSTASLNIAKQQLIYNYLKGPLLLEFLTRAKRNVLGNNIFNSIDTTQVDTDKITIISDVNISPYYDNPPDIYIIINVFEKNAKNNNIPIGHFTIHLIKQQIERSRNGPIHVVNNTSNRRRQRITLSKRSTLNRNGLLFELGNPVIPTLNIQGTMKIIINNIITILNAYFNPNDPLSLHNTFETQYATHDIINMFNIIERNNSMSTYNRKRAHTSKLKYKYNNRT